MPSGTPSFTSLKDIARLREIQSLLRGRGMTTIEVADKLCLSYPWTGHYIRHLRGRGEVYIQEWQYIGNTGTSYRAVYRWGVEEDAIGPWKPAAAVPQLREARIKAAGTSPSGAGLPASFFNPPPAPAEKKKEK